MICCRAGDMVISNSDGDIAITEWQQLCHTALVIGILRRNISQVNINPRSCIEIDIECNIPATETRPLLVVWTRGFSQLGLQGAGAGDVSLSLHLA